MKWYKTATEMMLSSDPKTQARQRSLIPAVYVTNNRNMANAYASGRTQNAHGGAGQATNGVIFTVGLDDTHHDIGGDIWKSWWSDLSPALQEFIQNDGDEDYITDEMRDTFEHAGIELDISTAQWALQNPTILLQALSHYGWSNLQDQYMGYSEVALDDMPWNNIIRIEEFGGDGSLTRSIPGGAKQEDFGEDSIYYHGSPSSHWQEKLKEFETRKNE